MKHAQLNKIIRQTGLSPERLAEYFGVSNMTLRRWSKVKGEQTLAKSHEAAVVEGIHRLISNGVLSVESAPVRQVLSSSPSNSFEAALNSMGVSPRKSESNETYTERMAMTLFQIGSNRNHQTQVERSGDKLRWFRKMGKDWKVHVTALSKVIKLKDIALMDKMIAYGALFYLIAPTDLIPDSIPFVGFVDDYGFIVMAAAYYTAKLPDLRRRKLNRP